MARRPSSSSSSRDALFRAVVLGGISLVDCSNRSPVITSTDASAATASAPSADLAALPAPDLSPAGSDASPDAPNAPEAPNASNASDASRRIDVADAGRDASTSQAAKPPVVPSRRFPPREGPPPIDPECNPPFTIDGQGRRRYKPQCL